MLLNSQDNTLRTQENHNKLAWRFYFDIAELFYQQLFLKAGRKKKFIHHNATEKKRIQGYNIFQEQHKLLGDITKPKDEVLHRLNVKTLGQDMEHCASCQDITGKSFHHLRSTLLFSPTFLYNVNCSPQVRKNAVKLDLMLSRTRMISTWQTCIRAKCLRDKTAVQGCSKSNQEWVEPKKSTWRSATFVSQGKWEHFHQQLSCFSSIKDLSTFCEVQSY